jgi:RNA methyltransferase, TrmH family
MPEITRITSRDNRRLVDVRKVRGGKEKGCIFVEGARLAHEALRSDLEITECIVSTSFLEGDRGDLMVVELSGRNIPIVETPDRLFSTLADTVNSQGVILVAKRPGTGPGRMKTDNSKNSSDLFVFLQGTNDPSNLGAVIRTAEAAGVAGVIVSGGSADVFLPKALRAGMGSTFRVPIWDGATLTDCMAWANENGIQTLAADISGRKPYSEIEWLKPSLVVFGSEAVGLSKAELDLADEVVIIPMQNGVESLNLAVSSGIILFEALRQKLAGSPV